LIVFEKITYKNFLSTGNTGQTLFLSRTPSALITGPNGAGKSTMLDALCFTIFNRPYRNVSKAQLLNTVNEKGLLVELDLKINQVSYKIIRGVKPNIFEIYKEGVLLIQEASLRDYQDKLEDIIGLNYKSFTQIVILGSARYQSFMDLSNYERRGIIEEILDITVFSKMNTILRSKVSDLDLNLKENDYAKDLNKTKISAQNGLIENIDARSKESTDKIEQEEVRTVAEINLLNQKLSELDSDIVKYTDMISSDNVLIEKLKQGEHQLVRVKTELKNHNKKLDFYSTKNTCPECEQPLTDDHKHQQIEFHNTKKSKADQIVSIADSAIKKLKEQTKANLVIKNMIYTVSGNKTKVKAEIGSKQSYMSNLNKNKNISADVKSLNDARAELHELKDLRKKVEHESIQLMERKHYLEVCKVLLKDTGIKAKIIKQYLPIMNKMINMYLDKMGANYSFNLDENFNEIIKSRYRDNFSYASFSEGEKMRIDLALMFTWREIAKIKNSVNTNLLIMDEVGDSSLDAEATDILWDILGEMSDVNVWIISHKTQSGDRFKTLIEFYKQGNFSYIKDSKV
tara:strand:+ start:2617 stop:4329 length:1713 start_codon:yes stop_codon:yes gene_type:complete